MTLWEKLTSFGNLYTAAKEAQRGKRFKPAVGRFHYDLAGSLIELRDELLSERYRPGPYRTFTIYEPARRFISAAPYRDRVVHHALCQTIEPLFERSFIFDSYANRVGKGTHRALDRCQQYCRRYNYVFQGDIRLFFPSIDHDILLARLARRIFDPQVLALACLILEHSNPQPPAFAYFTGDDLFTPYQRRFGQMFTLIRWIIIFATNSPCRDTSVTSMISCFSQTTKSNWPSGKPRSPYGWNWRDWR